MVLMPLLSRLLTLLVILTMPLFLSRLTLIPINFFFQAEGGIRVKLVTGVQTCALPISLSSCALAPALRPSAVCAARQYSHSLRSAIATAICSLSFGASLPPATAPKPAHMCFNATGELDRKSACRERV